MTTISDRYETYYAEKLWNLLPEVYRAEDSPDLNQNGPLREMVNRLGVQAAIVRRSIDRTWEDQAIETCDEWVIAYIGDLLATNLLASLDGRGKRLDVARTIHYRRRKGTVGVLEQIATDLTGWDARVVEFFRRMARARHGLDPEIGWPADAADPVGAVKLQSIQRLVGRHTRTTAGGLADFRSPHGARLTGTAFDEFCYTADVRVGRGHTGWYNIPRLGVFLWRLHSFPLAYVTPVQSSVCPDVYSFDPTGRRIPLFADSSRTYGDSWVSPEEHQVPGPIPRRLLLVALSELYATMIPGDPEELDSRSFGVFRQNGAFTDLIPREYIVADPGADTTVTDNKIYVDPEQGLLFVPPNPSEPIPGTGPYVVSYRYGFGSAIGAGGFDSQEIKRQSSQVVGTPVEVSGGGTQLTAALQASMGTGTVLITDSLTYHEVADLTVGNFVLQAKGTARPLIRLPQATPQWTFTGLAGSTLVLDGIFVTGGDIVLKGEFDSVTLRYVTFDPGMRLKEADGYEPAVDERLLTPSRLVIYGQVRCLNIEHSILGPLQAKSPDIFSLAGRSPPQSLQATPPGAVERVVIRDSIVQGGLGGDIALFLRGTGEVEMERVTVLGGGIIHRLHASDVIIHDILTVEDTQHGCVRFSAWAEGSMLPRRYESPMIVPLAPMFTSTRFGEPGYAQLALGVSRAIYEGGTGGSEPGAFWREKNAIKERSLLIRYQEYVPVGLSPVLIYVT